MTWWRLCTTLLTILISVSLVLPTLGAVATATREHAATVISGSEFEVIITPSGCGMFGQVIETLPLGFTYLSCNPDYVGVEKSGSTVKFTFAGSESFAYRLKAPSVTKAETFTFRGVLKDENKVQYSISDTTIIVKPPAPVTHTLTILVQGRGSTYPSPLISHVYEEGKEVEISAIPDEGWQFESWTGEVGDAMSSSTLVVMDKDQVIVANFKEIVMPVYTLALACKPKEGGEIVVSPLTSFNQYKAGSKVTLTAIPAEGYSFLAWQGDVSGEEESITLTIDCNRTIIATFGRLGEAGGLILSPLSITPAVARTGDQIRIMVSITNPSTKEISYHAFLFINGSLEDARLVTIPGYSSQNVEFIVTKETPGIYTASIGDQQADFVVNKNGLFSAKPRTGPLAAIVIIAGLTAALAVVLKRLKRKA